MMFYKKTRKEFEMTLRYVECTTKQTNLNQMAKRMQVSQKEIAQRQTGGRSYSKTFSNVNAKN